MLTWKGKGGSVREDCDSHGGRGVVNTATKRRTTSGKIPK